MNLANLLTVSRIILSPVLLLLYIEHMTLGISAFALPWVLLGLLVFSEFSDVLDGYLARKLHKVSDLGKILDPMADSIWRISIFLAFTQGPIHLPLVIVFVFLFRDSVIGTLRTVCALRGFALAARPSGKVKAVVQALAAFGVIILMIPHAMGYLSAEVLRLAAIWIVGSAAVYSLISGADYLWANREHIRKVVV